MCEHVSENSHNPEIEKPSEFYKACLIIETKP